MRDKTSTRTTSGHYQAARYRWVILGLLFGIGVFALLAANRAVRLQQEQQQKNHLERAARLIQSRLSTAIQIPLNTVISMQAFMLADRSLPSFKSFDRFAARVLRDSPAVTGFAIVDVNHIIRHFYPLKGNEKAIGLDLMTRPAAPYVKRAILRHIMTISPPTVTVQGRLSIIARIPLFRGTHYLGMVEGVIDIEKTLQLALRNLNVRAHVQLMTETGKRFWGPSRHSAMLKSFLLKVGDRHWQVRVWMDPSEKGELHLVRVLVWSIGSVLLLLLLYLVNHMFTEGRRLAHAVKRMTAQIAADEARWRSLLEQIHLIGLGLDKNGHVVYVNPFLCQVTGYAAPEMLGEDWFTKFVPEVRRERAHSQFNKLRNGGAKNRYINSIVTKAGEERVISWFNARIVNDEGEFEGSLSIGEDITSRKEMERKLDYLAYHDTLTGLPNRILFLDRLEHAVKRARRDNTLLALLVADLDQFKDINDSLGHLAGDILLQIAGQRFHNSVRSSDTVARIGGDEFTLLLENVTHIDIVENVAEKILAEFASPFEIEGNKLYVSASIGVVLYPMADDDVDDLLRAADTAMYYAKAAGRNCYRFYQASMTEKAHNQLSLASNLHYALEHDEFSLVFQPVVELETHYIQGYEALLRWHHSELGWVSPTEFIPVAESTGIIVQLGYWVLRHACRSFKAIAPQVNSPISISVNVSGYQFHDKDFIANFSTILTEENMAAQGLVVEITESQLMEDTQASLWALNALREMGCRIAIDDFGTGYSSLNYLRIFPVDILKIDRSFIADLTTDANSKAMLNAILVIADSLDLRIIAEGVETQAQLEILRELRISAAQGFYLGEPMRMQEIVGI